MCVTCNCIVPDLMREHRSCNACTMMRFLYHLIDKNIIISVSCNLISPVNVFDYVIADSTEL